MENMNLLSQVSLHAWIQHHRILTETGQTLDLRSHKFLFDPYRDFSPLQVVKKAAQIGFSTLAVLKTLWAAKHHKLDIIYTLPTANDVKDFVGGKVNRIVAQNPILQQYVQDKDSVEQKQVGEHLIYYRGSWTERAALMVSADLLVMDEFDRSKQDIIEQYSSRLQHSKHGWQWIFSNPSSPGVGVSRFWEQSDQKHWFVKCECGKEQYLDWPESVCPDRKVYQCKFCHAPLDDETRRRGRWVNKFTHENRPYSGYWIPLLIAPWVPATRILEYSVTKSPEYFSNFVMGTEYISEGNTVQAGMMYRNLTSNVNSQERVVIGCDSGIVKHFVIGNREGLFYYGKTEDWEDIRGYLKRFDRSILVVDHLPDITGPRKLREEFPGRVFLCHYARDRKTMQFIRWGKDNEAGNVIADRNRMIQLVVDEFADRRISLQGTRDDWSDYVAHWLTLYRTSEPDQLGQPQLIWGTTTGQDHWAHATVYWRIGMDRFGGESSVVTDSAPIRIAPAVGYGSDGGTFIPGRLGSMGEPVVDDWRT